MGSPLMGQCFDYERFSIKHVPPKPYDIHFKADRDVIAIMLSPFEIIGAFDSDQVSSQKVLADRVFFHPQGSVVYVRRSTNDGEFVSFHLEPTMRNALERELSVPIQPMRQLINVALPQAPMIGQMTQRFITEGQQGGQLVAESLATLALAEVVKVFADPQVFQRLFKPNLHGRVMQRIVDYINTHLSEDIGIDVLAREAAMSPYHFIRSFKEYHQVSPYAYVLQQRVERAKKLLCTSEQPIAQIAYACGFSSQSHMNVVFKRHTGVTPRRYRKHTSG
ncbi:MAG: helix-turn-helix transcriptional regulator [Cyanothece sp. SIO1E1]|nr:helix-turn-helix transcriptional regulator [Cyanothece sp. SIO1E1]